MMLCRRCAARFTPPRLLPSRTFTSTTTTHNPENPPAATSTSAAQPFSTPFTPSPANTPGIPSPGTKPPPNKPASHTPSSTLAGTPLRGLGYLKPPAPAPVAREDAEYPPWLWTLLSPASAKDAAGEEGEEAGGGDAFAKSKKQRRMAAKAARARVDGGMGGGVEGRKVERQRQSVDLAVDKGPGDGGAGDLLHGRGREEREGLQRAMRKERRAKVREGNFLRGMS